MNLDEFLTARWDEIEARETAKRRLLPVHRRPPEWAGLDVVHVSGRRPMVRTPAGDPIGKLTEMSAEETERYLAAVTEPAGDPYVLADIAAKRVIIEYVGTALSSWSDLPLSSRRGFERVLQFLTQPFADRPDYQEAWRPPPPEQGDPR